MATAGEVVIRITAEDDATKIVAKIKGALKQMGKEAHESSKETAKSFEDVKRELSSLSSKIFNVKNLIGGLFLGFSIERFVSGIIEAGSEVEGYRVQLEALMGSAEKANKALQDLIEYARTTPFETKNVVEAAVQLQAFGVNARELIPTLGDLAAAFNRDITEAVYAMTAAFTGQSEVLRRWGIDMRMKGEEVTFIWRDSINRMREITVQRSNEIIAQTLQMIFNEKYQGAVEEFKGTWRGLIMTLKSQWWEFKKAIAESGFLDKLKEKLQEVSNRINEMLQSGELQEKAQAISNALREMVEKTTDAAKALWKFRDAIIALMAVMAAGKVASAILSIASAVKVLKQATSLAIPSLTKFAGPLAAIGAAVGIVKVGWDAIQDAFDPKQFEDAGKGILVLEKRLADLYERLQYQHEAVLVTKEEVDKYKAKLEELAASHGKVLKVLQVGPEAYQLEFVWEEQLEQQTYQTAEAYGQLKDRAGDTHRTIAAAVPSLEKIKETLQSSAIVIEHSESVWEQLGGAIQKVHSDVSDSVTVWDWLVFKLNTTKSMAEELAESFAQSISQLTQELSAAWAQEIDTGLFEQSYVTTTESLQEQIEKQEELIEELQQRKMEALAEGKEKEVENIEAALQAHEQKKAELEQQLEELRAKHESTWARIWRSFRQNVIQNILNSVSSQLVPKLLSIGSVWQKVAGMFKSTTGSIVSSITSVISALGKELFQILKVAAGYIASAAAAAVKWLVETLGPWSVAAIPAALAGIYGIWEGIKGKLGFAEGGFVKLPIKAVPEIMITGGLVMGPAFPKDSVPAFLTGGEFVLRREAVQQIGIQPLQLLNERPQEVRIIKMSTGGYVGEAPSASSFQGNHIENYSIEVHFHEVKAEDVDELEKWARDKLPEILKDLKEERRL